MLAVITLLGSALAQNAPASAQDGLSTRLCDRIVAVGDLHGEWHHTLRILRASQLISDDKEPNWIADERTCLIQIGDLVDRGEFSKRLYDLFDRLRTQSNGRVMNLIGNHELMNIMGDMRYTTSEEDAHWGGAENRLKMWQGAWGRKLINEFRAAELQNGILFVHAGLHARFIDAHAGNFTALQHTVRQALLSLNTKGSFPRGTEGYFGSYGPFWTRDFVDMEHRKDGSEKSCSLLMKTLKSANAKRMVVGHTQVDGGINYLCGGHLIAIDTIISKAGYPDCWRGSAWCNGVASFLDLRDDVVMANEVSTRGEVSIVAVNRISLPGDVITQDTEL